MTPKEKLQQAMTELGITVDTAFVPWSQSRNFKAGAKLTERSLNWRVTVKRGDREVLTTDYSAGIGHAPSYRQGMHTRLTPDVAEALEHETEHGTQAKPSANLGRVFSGKPIEADACDVIYSLVSDSDVIDHPSFESWAGDLGYDVDSRKAEATYRACLETALKLRAALGDAGLTMLREACTDY